jgi:hypothetical protein
MVPVVIGLAVGVSLIVLFIVLSGQLSQGEQVDTQPQQVWVAKNATQCSEPWQMEDTTLEGFFSDRGVQIYGIQTIRYLGEDMAVCMACDCPSGSTLYLKVGKSGVPTMGQYGFILQSP